MSAGCGGARSGPLNSLCARPKPPSPAALWAFFFPFVAQAPQLHRLCGAGSDPGNSLHSASGLFCPSISLLLCATSFLGSQATRA